MARCFSGRTNFSAAALIRSRTSTIRPARAIPSRAAWPVISRARPRAKSDFSELRKALIYGSVLASFNVEAFSMDRMRSLTSDEIDERYQMFKLMSQFEVLE